MSFKRNNKLQMENILVGNGDQVVATGSLVDNTTTLGVAPSQLGVISWDFEGTDVLGNFITPGATIADVKAIKVIQGTPASANTSTADLWEYSDKGKMESNIIYSDKVRSVTVRKPRPGSSGLVAFTDFGTVGSFAEYSINTRLDSVRIERDFGPNDLVMNEIYTTPDLVTLGVVDGLDLTLSNLLYRINTRSKAVTKCYTNTGSRNVLGLGINFAGGAGVAIGALTCGDIIPVMSDSCTSGTPVISNVVADLPMLAAFAKLITDQAADATVVNKITAASTIELIDLSIAGTVANITAMIVLGLEEEVRDAFTGGFEHGIYNTMTRVDAHLGKGFTSPNAVSTTRVLPVEAVNDGRDWYFQNQRRAQLNIHTMQSATSDEHSIGSHYVEKNVWYTSEIVDYYDFETTLTLSEPSPKQLIILLPATIDCVDVNTMVANIAADGEPLVGVTTADTANTVPSANTVPELNASLNTWLESARTSTGFSLKGDATPANYLV